jgi:DNA excision repair protein ERCC-3
MASISRESIEFIDKNGIITRDYSKVLNLKQDHERRPVWVVQEYFRALDDKSESVLNWVVILEAFSPYYQKAYDFLVAIAEPVSRPQYIHRYKLTPHSLYAAVSVAIEPEAIISTLDKLCKTNLPKELVDYVHSKTSTFGKAKLVLKNNQFYVESSYPDVLKRLLQIEDIAYARSLAEENEVANEEEAAAVGQDGFIQSIAPEEIKENRGYTKIGSSLGIFGDEEEDDEEDDDFLVEFDGNEQEVTKKKQKMVSSILIHRDLVTVVKEAANKANYPLMQEYDFKNDRKNPNLKIDIRPSTKIRTYQEKSLAKMFGNGRAR